MRLWLRLLVYIAVLLGWWLMPLYSHGGLLDSPSSVGRFCGFLMWAGMGGGCTYALLSGWLKDQRAIGGRL